MIEYQNFDIEIQGTAETAASTPLSQPYCVRVTGSRGGEADEPFVFPFADLELENFVLRLASQRSRVRRKMSEQQASIRKFGTRLFAALMTGNIGRVFERSKAIAAEEGKGLRIRLRLRGAPGLLHVPWEYLFDPVEGDFVAASKYTPIVRYIDMPKPTNPLPVPRCLRVLVIAAAPQGEVPLDIDGEIAKLRAALKQPVDSHSIELEVIENVTLRKLLSRLRDVTRPLHALHFIGHGQYDEARESGTLVFEDEASQPNVVDADDFARLVADHRSIRLVVLNSCEGARTTREDPLAGVAQTLLRRGIVAVVAMQFEISDAAAVAISQEIYTCLAMGLPLESAVSEARIALLAMQNHVEWATPVLFLRAQTGDLFELSNAFRRPVDDGLPTQDRAEAHLEPPAIARPALFPIPEERHTEPEVRSAPAPIKSSDGQGALTRQDFAQDTGEPRRRRILLTLGAVVGVLGIVIGALAYKPRDEPVHARSVPGRATEAPASTGEEKALNLYIWNDYLAADTISNFEKETGINVSLSNYGSNEELEAKLAPGNAGYDVVMPSASSYERQIKAGYYQKLDKSLLPNLKNMDPDIEARLAMHDPGNDYAVLHMWGTTGIGYNVRKIKDAMPNAPFDSWKLVFDPETVSKFKKCGVALLDSATEMYSMTLAALGKDPNSQKPEDLEAATNAMVAIRPSIRYFDTQRMISDLANGEVCLAIGYNGDILQARDRAEENKTGQEIAYSIPKEGTIIWFDSYLIPKDAPHPKNAHAFINYMLRPEVIAAVTNTVRYPNGNAQATQYVDKDVLTDPSIYPSQELKERLAPDLPETEETMRIMTRGWQRFTTGRPL